jgi:hypothetical protein
MPSRRKFSTGLKAFDDVQEYWIDACQRSVLFLDVLRQRGNIYRAHNARAAPNVLDFEARIIRDGRTLPRPVNYVLARIIPPEGVTLDPAKPPYVVVDPRAGHGPGIGGMKHVSEIGVAMEATSSASCPSPSWTRPSRTSVRRRRCSSRKWRGGIGRPTASR